MSITNDLNALIASHRAAFTAYDEVDDENWNKPVGVATGKALDAAQHAMLNHRPITIEEVWTKATYMASCRTFTEWDDFDQVKLIEALTPAGALGDESA